MAGATADIPDDDLVIIATRPSLKPRAGTLSPEAVAPPARF
jgi:hypothetical protein